jgi:hypothetical protein
LKVPQHKKGPAGLHHVRATFPRVSHDAALSAGLQVLVPVERNDHGVGVARPLKRMMGTLDSDANPIVTLKDTTHALSQDRLHKSIS